MVKQQRIKPNKKRKLNSKPQNGTYEVNIQRNEPNDSSFNLIGLGQDTSSHQLAKDMGTFSSMTCSDNLDDCLAEMEKSTLESNLSKSLAKPEDSDRGKSRPAYLTDENSQKTQGEKCVLWRGPPPPAAATTHRASFHLPIVGEDFPLPHLQVELLRHKNMENLSKFLLSKCKHLRMPSFERWVIDSKLEEMAKRQRIQEQNEIRASRDSLVPQKEEGWRRRMKRKRHQVENSLEKHLTSSGLRPQVRYDPVIPSMADVEDEASKRLILEMEFVAGIKGDELDANNICKELCEQSCEAAKQLQNLEQRLGSVSASHYYTKGNGRIHLEVERKINDAKSNYKHDTDAKSSNPVYALVFSRKNKTDGKKMKPFVIKINSLHYEKLRHMFHSVHDRIDCSRPLHVPSPIMTLGTHRGGYSAATHIFHHLLFCLELRYASLAGGQQLHDLRGGGMQGAIHSQVFDCISKYDNTGGPQQNVIMECFASPLNVYSSSYFSIFHRDLDWHFGSCGDFFSVPIGFFRSGGTHEANPPFSPGLMQKMIQRMEEHLEFADSIKGQDSQSNLTFVVVVPTCHSIQDTDKNIVHEFALKSFHAMIKSRYLSKHFVLKSREHGYIEGSQHLRPTRYKESQYDTSVIILQSKAAKEKGKSSPNFTSKDFEDDLRLAFASRHQLELGERRQVTPSLGNAMEQEATKEDVKAFDVEASKNKFQRHGKDKSKKKRKVR